MDCFVTLRRQQFLFNPTHMALSLHARALISGPSLLVTSVVTHSH